MSEDINLGNITEAVNNKADIDLQNTDLAQADYVIERGGDSNSWYRLWKSGWLEQGGGSGLITDFGTGTITFKKPFRDPHYTLTLSNWRNGTTDDAQYNSAGICNLTTKTASSFQIYSRGATDGGRYYGWYACGYAE